MYVVPGLPCQHKKKGAERASVTFSEWVNGIELDRVFGGARHKILGTQAKQVVF
jgi:hypothetical protein